MSGYLKFSEIFLLLGILVVTTLTYRWNRRAAFFQEASVYMQNVAKSWSDRPAVSEVKDVIIRSTRQIPLPGKHTIPADTLRFQIDGLKPKKYLYPSDSICFQINIELLCGLYNNSWRIYRNRRVRRFLYFYIRMMLMYFKKSSESFHKGLSRDVSRRGENFTQIQNFIQREMKKESGLLEIWEEMKKGEENPK